MDLPSRPVYIRPFESQELTPPHPGKNGSKEEREIFRIHILKESFYLIHVEEVHLFPLSPWLFDIFCRIG
ncbi:MAG: hypothetical protein WA148_06820 [Actinomycetota bacterium]